MRYDYTKRKFLTLPIEQQHKKGAEILRHAYFHLGQNQGDEALKAYCGIADWMGMLPLSTISSKSLSDRYHFHLNLAGKKHKEHHLLPRISQVSISCCDKGVAEQVWPIAIYLDHLRSAHNVGSILRTVEAFSLGEVYFSDTTPTIDNKQVNDAAMGANQWVTCHNNAILDLLPRPLIALETASDATPLSEFSFPDTFTLIVGNEEYGCSDSTLESADHLVQIPLRGHKNSLNVANAFAIAAAEIARQRSPLLNQHHTSAERDTL